MPASSTLIRRDKDFISTNMHKNALVRAMRKHGLTATKVIKPIVEALEATKTISAVNGKDADKDTMDFIEVPDHQTRLRAAQLSIELLGLKKDNDFDMDSKKNKDKVNKTIANALQKGDEIELQRIVFNKQGEDGGAEKTKG